jgi:hypothetical protein
MQLLHSLFFCSIPVVYFWLEIRFDFDFVENGILPRTLSGLQGVFLVRLFMLIWSIFIIQFLYLFFYAALQFFLSRSNRDYLIRVFIFRIDYLDYWQKQLPHKQVD